MEYDISKQFFHRDLVDSILDQEDDEGNLHADEEFCKYAIPLIEEKIDAYEKLQEMLKEAVSGAEECYRFRHSKYARGIATDEEMKQVFEALVLFRVIEARTEAHLKRLNRFLIAAELRNIGLDG